MSKYEPITRHLNAQSSHRVTMGFAEIERLIGFPLPQSARKYPAWWSNDPATGRQSGAWLAVSWKTEDVDLAGERVSFCRGDRRNAALRPARMDSQPAAAPAAQGRDDREASDGFEMKLALRWRVVGTLSCDANGELVFPKVEAVSGLYRFRLVNASGQRSYIGETINLKRRFAHYRKPGPTQATNIRMNGVLREHLLAGDVIEIDVATDGAWLQIDGRHYLSHPGR